MKLVKYPKKFNPPQGMSPQSIFLKGPEKWKEKLIEEIDSKLKKVTVISSPEDFDIMYDMKHLGEAEYAIIYFSPKMDVRHTLLFPTTYWEKFSPPINILIDDKHPDAELIKVIGEKCKVNFPKNLNDTMKGIYAALSSS